MFTKSRLFRFLAWLVLIVVILFAYVLSIKVTKPDLYKLVTSASNAKQILPQLLSPDLFTRESETKMISLPFPIPCGSAPEAHPAESGLRLLAEPACGNPMEEFTLKGMELPANTDVKIVWRLPDDRTMALKHIMTDANGGFEETVQARPIVATQDGKPASIEAEVTQPGGKLHPSQALTEVLNAIIVTIFMALLATTLGTILAAPLSFLAAQNITRRGCAGSSVYYATRSVLNVIRSFELLVMATIFALMTEFGSPFAGVLAMAVVTTASLGKMFSEAVESIDPGPIEAVTATGANRMQVVMFFVVPQIIPNFLSFIIYHWDINVRISTIIGFVGGGGIGYYLSQRINSFEYHQASTALAAILIVVWVLDFLSAEIRERVT